MERLWKTDRRKNCLNSRNMREQKVFLRKYYNKNIKHVEKRDSLSEIWVNCPFFVKNLSKKIKNSVIHFKIYYIIVVRL